MEEGPKDFPAIVKMKVHGESHHDKILASSEKALEKFQKPCE